MSLKSIELENTHATRQFSGRIREATPPSPLLTAACAAVLGGILVAGLWPFHAPANQVAWLANGNGVHLGDYGTLLSTGPLVTSTADRTAPCSLEIWLAPAGADDSMAILSFYVPGSPWQFSIRQSKQDLELLWESHAKVARSRRRALYVDNAFTAGSPVFVTITSAPAATRVYLNGSLAREASHFPLSAADFAGTVVVANSPFQNDSWRGDLHGLAFYAAALQPVEAMMHYRDWTSGHARDLALEPGIRGLFLFNEHAGRTVHNLAASGAGLTIPARYTVLHEKFLELPWQEFSPDEWYLKDVLINIGGFVPLGFVFLALFKARNVRRDRAVTILLGALTSITIEVLQAFLPTRDSGMTDIFTNTLGTAIGVMLYPSVLVRKVCGMIPWAGCFYAGEDD